MAEATISGPRPLQLASGSAVTSQVFLSSRNPSGDATVSTRQAESEDAQQTASLYTPPSSARAKNRSSNRRHSSISYIHSETCSPFQASFRRDSADVFMKSPLSDSHPKSSQFPPVGQLRRSPGSHMSRNKSPSGPVERNVKDKRASNRTSNGSLIEDSKMVDAVKERPPVTLAEKHAELLHFIAQKESKCLELKSQLAIHEAELLQLKRKWELIVNRGFEKSQTLSPTSLSIPSPTAPFPGPSAYAISPQSASSPYFPVLPGAHAHAPVLEGIKEGVQGMSRLIVAGFESIAGGPFEPSHGLHQAGVSSLHQPPLPLLLRSNSKLDRKPVKRHGQNESQSSSSTVTSTSTQASATDTTATSIRSSFSFDGPASVTVSQTSTQVNNKEQEGKDSFENSEEQPKNSSPVSDRSEQVLMVRDTGATPTMSPNPDFEQKRWSRKLNERQGGTLTDSSVKKNNKNEEDIDPWFGHDNDWDESSPSPRREQRVLKPSVNARRSATAETSMQVIQSSEPPPSLPPMSTIPGLATMNLAGPAAQQMSSWMGNVGKKLGEITGSSTFTKSQKRASLLLSDIQNTFVSSLISPTPMSSHSPSASATKEKLPVLPIFASGNTLVSQPTSASSLLDEFDDGEMTGGPNTDTTHTLLKTPVLVPSVRKSPEPSMSSAILKRDQDPCLETGSKGGSEFDDDWNW